LPAFLRPFALSPFALSPLTVLSALLTLSHGIQRKRTASISGPAFLLDDSERGSLEMPDLRTPANFYSVV
jgi:hypothetical protein